MSSLMITPKVEASRPATADEMWEAVRRRDPAYDGVFFVAVRTTGVYCRPSCKSRPPKRENLSFFPSAEAAERAGFRACKRCRPDRLGAPDPQVEAVSAPARKSRRPRRRPRSPTSRRRRA